MKKLTPILILSLLFLSCGDSQKEYDSNDLVEMDNGLWTEKFSDEPITGKVFNYYGEKKPSKKVYMGNLRNGKQEGKWVDYYHFTGKKKSEETFKDGKRDGLFTTWYENGQKEGEVTFKNGKEDGLVTQWYENGQMKSEVNYKDGKEDGLLTNWYENGQKKGEGTFKDGKSDGLVTIWYENGQKSHEGTFKDDEKISSKEWNEDGSVKE